MPDWVWSVDEYEFEWHEMPSCWDPTYCTDPFPPINGTNVQIIAPEGTLKYKDGEQILYRCKSPAYVFPDPSKPQSEWANELEVTCEWENKWSHSLVPRCIDPRGCDLPPERTPEIYASYHHNSEVDEYLPVGTLVWYQCEDGNNKFCKFLRKDHDFYLLYSQSF